MATFFFLKIPRRGRVLSRLPWNRPWSSPSRSPTVERRPRPPNPPAAWPARGTADRRLRILERLTRLALAHITRRGDTAPRRRQIIARMLESREIDPPVGFVQLQIAPLSEATIVARTMVRERIRTRWVDCSNSTASRASRSRRFRFPAEALLATAQTRGRDANWRRRIRRRRKPGRNFSWLQSLEIARNGIGIGGRNEGGVSAVADVCAARRPSLGRAYRADSVRRAQSPMRNFPPHNPLESLTTAK
jgi:hypothetical protein